LCVERSLEESFYQVFDRIIGENLKRLIWIAAGISVVTVVAALIAAVIR
jgi:hypothetical protein